jgi:hypothetical protein
MVEQIAGYLQRNLVVFLSVLVLPLKWTVVRICRDREAEGAAILAVPEDLCYVALGLVLGDVINSQGAFHRHFKGSPYPAMDMFVTVGFGLGFALSIHLLGQWSMLHFKSWRAAESAPSLLGASKIPNAEKNFLTLTLRHMFLFLFGYGAQLGMILPWLHWIAGIISDPASGEAHH